MKRIIGIFTAFLLPALPAFGASSATQNKVLSINGGAKVSDGKENITLRVTVKSPNACKIKGSSLHTANSDLVHTIECPSTATSLTLQYSIDDQKQAFAYNIENPTQTIKLNKARSGYNLPEKIQITKKQATSKQKTTTAAPADEDFDFVAAQKRDRAAYETDYEAEPYGTTTTTAKPKSTIRAGDDDELQRVGEIHAADAEADAERSQPKQTKQTKKQEPDFDFAAASANDMNTTVARSGLGNTLAPEPTTPEKSERQKQIEENTKKSLTVQPKPEKKKIAQTANEKSRLTRTAIDKFCKDDGYVYKKNAIETPSIGYVQDLCNSESKVKFVCYNFKGASIPTQEIIKHFANYCYTNTTNSCESIKESRPSDHYNKKDAQRAEKVTCNWSTHYLDSKKNKCVAKSTVKCANDEVVNNEGKCQKNVSVTFQKPGDMTGHEWSQNDRERMKCDQDKDKKHTKFENNKCVCESADYEMQSDGYCTLKRAKCLKQRNTKYENGRCVCESSDFEMHKDNNCYYTAEAIDRNEEEMLAADEEETNKKLNASAKQGLCELTDGTWKNGKCKCPNGYELSDTGECEMTKKTQTAAEKQKSCTDSGGTWSKNTCKCEKRNTILLNDECVCISGDFEMHADKACYYTAEAIDRNEEEMIREDENKSHIETLKLLCEGGETKGTWTDDFKCECPDGYAVSSTNECEITDEAQKNANKEKACTETDGKWNNKTNECKCKTGFIISREGKCVSTYDEEKANSCAETGGKWTKKNTCNCKNGWNLDADGFCQPNDKTAANNHKKELCTEPNKWNDTLKKCTCKDKKQFFDEETGCVSATADFLAAETELNTLKQQFETKKAELASAN